MGKLYANFKKILISLFTGGALFVNAQTTTTVTLGSGTTVPSNTTAGPINEYYRSSHSQMLYTKAEINAGGAFGGTMIQFGFYVSSGVTNPLPNFTIKMKNTSAVDVASYDANGLTTVYNTASYSPVAGGYDMLTLTTPFLWNGVDNILVDVCFDQVSAYTSTGRVRTYSPAVTNGFIYVRLDSSPQCGVACSSVTTDKPQAQMIFLPPPPLDLGISNFIKPISSNRCFMTDSIITRVTNFGSASVDFSVNTTTVTVMSTGAVSGTYTTALTSGTLAVGSYTDVVINPAYNMALLGTYNLKGYTTVTGDGQALNDTLQNSYTRQPFFSYSTNPNDSVCLGVPIQLGATVNSVQLGNGSVTNAYYSYPAPYGNWEEGAKHQFLFTAAELNAAGLIAGNIQSISFNALALNNTNPLTNFAVSISTTTLSSLTSTIQTGLTPVYSAASYTPVLGINTHTFSAPFAWNGTDNILLETCFNNYPNGSTENVVFSQTNMPFNASAWYDVYNTPGLCTSSGGGASFSTMRPDVQFGQTVPTTYSWTPSVGLSSTSISNPVANLATSTTYTVMLNLSPINCMSYDTIHLTVKQTPNLNLGHDTTVCTANYILNGGGNASTWQWSNGASTNTISVVQTGTYAATATSTMGCVKHDTVSVTFAQLPIVTLGPDTGYCQGSYITLNSGNPSDYHTWGKLGGGFSSSAPSVTVNTAGTYYVVVTSPLSTSCTQKDTVVVSTKTLTPVSLVFHNPTMLCQFDTPRSLSEGTPAGGHYIGAGVSGSTFNPALTGPGSYVIVYSYTGSNGCVNDATDTLRVKTCTGIEEYSETASVSLYPNPNSGEFTVSIDAVSETKATISILTIDGRVVYEEHVVATAGGYTQGMNVSSLADGIYYLRMQTSNAVRMIKLIKQ